MTDPVTRPTERDVADYLATLPDWERELLVDLTPDGLAAIHAYLRGSRSCCGRPRTDLLTEVTCAFDNCVEWRCACGASDGGWGPVGCPCQDVPGPTTEEVP